MTRPEILATALRAIDPMLTDNPADLELVAVKAHVEAELAYYATKEAHR